VEDVDNDNERKAARLQAEAEAEALRGGGSRGERVKGANTPKRRVPGGASRRTHSAGGR